MDDDDIGTWPAEAEKTTTETTTETVQITTELHLDSPAVAVLALFAGFIAGALVARRCP